MAQTAVLDTDVFIDHLRRHAPATELLKSTDFLFSAITEAELLRGTENNDSVRRSMLITLLQKGTKIPVDNPLVISAGDIARRYGLETPDAIIAATALQENAVLFTRNMRDFKKVPGLKVKKPY